MKTYKLFLDDIRDLRDVFNYTYNTIYSTEKWIIVRNAEEFKEMILVKFQDNEFPDLISFDHDLADAHYDPDSWTSDDNYPDYEEETGYHCAKWLCEFCMEYNMKLPDYLVHSMNPVGKQNIITYLENFNKYRK